MGQLQASCKYNIQCIAAVVGLLLCAGQLMRWLWCFVQANLILRKLPQVCALLHEERALCTAAHVSGLYLQPERVMAIWSSKPPVGDWTYVYYLLQSA